MSNDDFPANGEIILYQTEDGRTRVECRFADETLWMSQALMAWPFQTSPQNITLHLKALYAEGELSEQATCKAYLQVRLEGACEVKRAVKHYNLDAILAVGYRVRSPRGTQFRRWATERLSKYLVKGFTMDDERLKHPPVPGAGVPDYFDELLERIRDIRASERRMYLRMRGGAGKVGDQPAVARTGLEHVGRSRAAARLEVQHQAHVLHGGMLAGEGMRPQQAPFLGVAEEEDQVVGERQNAPIMRSTLTSMGSSPTS
jgi:hypothetical protein